MKFVNVTTGRRRSSLRLHMTGFLAAGLLGSAVTAQAAPGAIWTSLKSGESVNANLYTAKCGDLGVWLNGGPNNSSGGAGLPPGTYVFQVTDPSGATLLSSDEAIHRQALVDSTGYIVGTFGPGHDVSDLDGIPGGPAAIELCPFDNTPNNGGEYKVWLTPVGDFTGVGECSLDYTQEQLKSGLCKGNFGFVGGHIKTDNFKAPDEVPECTADTSHEADPDCYCEYHPDDVELCGGGEEPSNTISGKKCYDFDTNGTCDDNENEPGIPNWHVDLFQLIDESYAFQYGTTTDAFGDYLFQDLDAGTYGVCEVFPKGPLSSIWLPTTPASISPIDVPPNSEGNNFGNVCLGAGGGKTLGFWSNKNGQAAMNDGGTLAPELLLLSNLNLKDALGNNFNPTTYPQFRTWILNATAVNMAYMLSAQLAAMELNVEAGFVSGGALVYIGKTDCTSSENEAGFISISNLMNDADVSLGMDGYTPDGDANRACQEVLKTTLDKANNNLNFVSDFAHCVIDYNGDETCDILAQ
ncbi:MAG: SdrD B-like domain-containing protein [Methylomicrobium sp.]